MNSRKIQEDLEPCIFGHTLLRIIYKIVHLRETYPEKIIWMRKEDTQLAYRRIYMNTDTVILVEVQLPVNGEEYLLLSLRLPFGCLPCSP